jgi:hypothetical protein
MVDRDTTVIVKIWGTEVQVNVFQTRKTVWIAVGNYMGVWIRTTGSSGTSARARWRQAAQYQGKLDPAVAGTSIPTSFVHPLRNNA